MEERARRVAENEVLFREVNEDVIPGADGMPERFEIICECGALTCVQRLTVTRESYAHVRNHDTDFLLVPGHEDPELEIVIDRQPGAYVVRKIGLGAVVARDARRA